MNSGLSQLGATPFSPAYAAAAAAAARAEATAQGAGNTPAVSAVKPDRPSANAYQARENIRQQVMAERGVDLLDLYRMGSLRRIRTEAAIAAETADRTRRAQQPGLGTLIDLRV